MKKSILLLVFFNLTVSIQLFGQDVIVKENGEEIKSKVVEVDKNEITYKNFDDPEFTNFTVPVKDVKKIRYENGTEKIFKKYLKHYIGFSIGKSITLGDYASNNSFSSKAGYAISGNQFSIDWGVYIVRNFGIAGTFGSFNNKQDKSALQEPYHNTAVTLDFEKDQKWKGGFFLIGPQYSFKLGKRFSIDLKAMIGDLGIRKPSINMHYRDQSNKDYNYLYQSGNGSSFAFSLGTGFRYDFSKRVGLRLAWEMIHAKPYIHYKVEVTDPNSGGQKRTEDNTLIQNVDFIKTGIGFVFLIGR